MDYLFLILFNLRSVYDSITETRVAIKKISRCFETEIHAKRAYREIKLLKHLNHDNLIRLYNVFSRVNSPDELNNV